MRRKIITKDCIGLIKTINIIPMFIFIKQNPLNVWQAGWLLMSFFIEILYFLYACRLLALPYKGKTLELNKRDEGFCCVSFVFSLVSTFVAAGAMTSDNLALKYTLIGIWSLLVVVRLISQVFVDKKILNTTLIDIDKIDFKKLTNARVECTNEDTEYVSVCSVVLIIMSVIQTTPAFAVIFEDNPQTMLWIYIIATILCSLLLLTLFYFLYKKVKPIRKKAILTYLIYLAALIIEGVIVYLVYNRIGVDWVEEYIREIVFIPYFISLTFIWILLVFPVFKHYRAMMAYLQDNNES